MVSIGEAEAVLSCVIDCARGGPDPQAVLDALKSLEVEVVSHKL